jgi:hypothetical protein
MPIARRGAASTLAVEPYEDKFSRNPEWGMNEGGKFFEERSHVQDALRKITKRLSELGIDHAVVGGMALFRHGYRRFTEDVNLLVTREGLKEIHRQLDGMGYVPPFQGSKNLRETEHGVKIEFLITGEFPGHGKPKPVAFPTPESVAVEIDGIRYISLPALIELKIASGMTNSQRAKDIGGVVELIKNLGLPLNLSETMHPFVQARYKQLWADANPPAIRYVVLFPSESLGAKPQSLEEMIEASPAAADTLRSMLADGVALDAKRGAPDGYVRLMTTDPAIAKKYDMHDESEFLGEDGAGEAQLADET